MNPGRKLVPSRESDRYMKVSIWWKKEVRVREAERPGIRGGFPRGMHGYKG
jgi:hypothetical protein